MIYYFTKRHPENFPQIQLEASLRNEHLIILDRLDCLLDWLTITDLIYFDKEFSNLNVLYATPLLSQYGNATFQFIVDDCSFPVLDYLEPFKHKTFVGHNIKIDISVARLQGINIRNIEDTMITEQRLGLDSGRYNNLEASYNRRCGKELPQDKNLGKEFAKMNNSSAFEFKHIFYSAMDIKVLEELRTAQQPYIKKFNYYKLLYDIEFPLVPILADMELEGFTINKEGWKTLVKDNKTKLFNIEKKLDIELLSIGFNNKSFRHIRQKAEFEQTSLFGDSRMYENTNANKINYSSSPQVIKLFKDLDLIVPNLIKKETNKVTGTKGNVDKDSVQIEALQAYNLNHPDNVFYKFLETLIEYKETEKEISSFGEKFYSSHIYKKSVKKPVIGYLNPKTDKIHTIYRQCFTKTGRLASGEAKIGLYNSQQIPASKKYRTLFTLTQKEIDDDWWITTADLTGAEVVIMCAFAKDSQLYKWAVEEDDLHSPLATACWREVYKFRKLKQERAWITGGRTDKGIFKITSISTNKETDKADVTYLTEDFLIDKNTNTTFRTDFKPVGFGVIYGAGAKVIAKVLNISVEEAKIIIATIKKLIPETFRMVEAAATFASKNAYVIHNDRTNSRSWFMSAFKTILSDQEKANLETEARNRRIQSTQADLLKEAMVNVYNYFEVNNIPNKPLLQVHDELVWKHKGKENGLHIFRIMGETATLYLEGFTEMKAEGKTLRTWIK